MSQIWVGDYVWSPPAVDDESGVLNHCLVSVDRFISLEKHFPYKFIKTQPKYYLELTFSLCFDEFILLNIYLSAAEKSSCFIVQEIWHK